MCVNDAQACVCSPFLSLFLENKQESVITVNLFEIKEKIQSKVRLTNTATNHGTTFWLVMSCKYDGGPV